MTSSTYDIIADSPPDPQTSIKYTEDFMKLKADYPEFEFHCVPPRDITEIIKKMKSTGAVGHDKMSTQVLKKFEQVLTPYITKIINLAIMTSTYPQTWKYGIISPVPKSGDLMIDKNWRPVTLLPVMSKC